MCVQVLDQAGVANLADSVVSSIASADTAVMGGACAEATPLDGTVVECDVRPGDTLQWMAYRPKPNGAPALLSSLRWAGAKPFRAFLFRVTKDNRIYTFVVPKICGNLSLMGVQDIPRAPVAAPPPAPAPPPPPPPAPMPAPAVAPPPPPCAARAGADRVADARRREGLAVLLRRARRQRSPRASG